MRRRAPFVKMPGDSNNRFGNTELTQAFEVLVGATTIPSRRQIVNAAALSGTRSNICCDTTVVSGGSGSSTTSSGTGVNTQSGSTVQAKLSGIKTELNDVDYKFDQQTLLNSDITLLLSDLYTQTGYTPPIPVPTDPTNPS